MPRAPRKQTLRMPRWRRAYDLYEQPDTSKCRFDPLAELLAAGSCPASNSKPKCQPPVPAGQRLGVPTPPMPGAPPTRPAGPPALDEQDEDYDDGPGPSGMGMGFGEAPALLPPAQGTYYFDARMPQAIQGSVQ